MNAEIDEAEEEYESEKTMDRRINSTRNICACTTNANSARERGSSYREMRRMRDHNALSRLKRCTQQPIDRRSYLPCLIRPQELHPRPTGHPQRCQHHSLPR